MALNLGFSRGFQFTMAAQTGSATVSLPEGFQNPYLQVSSLPSATSLDVYASVDGGTTYYQLRHYPSNQTATVAAPSFIVAGIVMTHGGIVPVPPGFQYYRIKCTDSNPSAALTFTLLGST